MPSPFPGMDPWLEDPDRWPGVHNVLIGSLLFALNAVIRPKYFALIEERLFVADDPEARRSFAVADVMVGGGREVASGPAVVEQPVLMRAVSRLRERRVEIVDRVGGSVVTVVEILSPTNKRYESTGRTSFLRKRRQVLQSTANWVEIDLLRGGGETFNRPPDRRAEYAAHISPAGLRPKALVLPIRLTAPLPVIGIPLREPDPDAPVDLQAVLTDAYARGSFDGIARYPRPPVPSLPPELDGWADALLKEKGLR